MNSFIKTNSRWLALLGFAVVIVTLIFIFRPKTPTYQLNTNETIKMMNDRTIELEIKDIAGKQLIDIRSAELYSNGHPASAINIPIRTLLNKESLELFDDLLSGNKDAVLYGTNELQATAPLFLLRQLGYKNVKLLKGGLNQHNEFIQPVLVSTEVSVVDTAAIHGKTEPLKAATSEIAKKKGDAVIPVRKGASAGGGC